MYFDTDKSFAWRWHKRDVVRLTLLLLLFLAPSHLVDIMKKFEVQVSTTTF